MDQRDTLMMFAEIALALGGFTAVVLALSSRRDGTAEMSRPVVAAQLLTIFSAAAIPLVCIAVLNFGVGKAAAWKAGSGLQVAATLIWLVFIVPRGYALGIRSRLDWLIGAGAVANLLMQTGNLFWFFADHEFAIMFTGLVWYFVGSAIILAKLLIERSSAA